MRMACDSASGSAAAIAASTTPRHRPGPVRRRLVARRRDQRVDDPPSWSALARMTSSAARYASGDALAAQRELRLGRDRGRAACAARATARPRSAARAAGSPRGGRAGASSVAASSVSSSCGAPAAKRRSRSCSLQSPACAVISATGRSARRSSQRAATPRAAEQHARRARATRSARACSVLLVRRQRDARRPPCRPAGRRRRSAARRAAIVGRRHVDEARRPAGQRAGRAAVDLGRRGGALDARRSPSKTQTWLSSGRVVRRLGRDDEPPSTSTVASSRCAAARRERRSRVALSSVATSSRLKPTIERGERDAPRRRATREQQPRRGRRGPAHPIGVADAVHGLDLGRAVRARAACGAAARCRRRACCRGRSRRAASRPARARGGAPPRRAARAARASSRNSVGVSATRSPPSRDRRARTGSSRSPPALAAPTSPPLRRSSACSRATSSANANGFVEVVVAAGAEPGEPIGERVARGQEQHRRLDAARAQRLADVAAVGVGQADVDHERIRRRSATRRSRSPPSRPSDLEALLASPARRSVGGRRRPRRPARAVPSIPSIARR